MVDELQCGTIVFKLPIQCLLGAIQIVHLNITVPFFWLELLGFRDPCIDDV